MSILLSPFDCKIDVNVFTTAFSANNYKPNHQKIWGNTIENIELHSKGLYYLTRSEN